MGLPRLRIWCPAIFTLPGGSGSRYSLPLPAGQNELKQAAPSLSQIGNRDLRTGSRDERREERQFDFQVIVNRTTASQRIGAEAQVARAATEGD